MLADWLCQNIRKCLPLVSTTFSNRQVYPVSIKQYTFSSKDSVKQYLIVCLVALDVAEDRANLLISSSWGHTLVLRAERDGSSSMLASTAGGQWVSSRKLWLRLPSSFENRSSTLSSITQWNRMRVGKVIWFFLWKNEWFILFPSSYFWVEQMDKLFALIPKPLVTSMYFFYRSLSLGLSRKEREREKNREQRRTRAEQD